MPGDSGDNVLFDSLDVRNKILKVYYDIQRQGYSKAAPFSIANVEDRMKSHADTNNVTIAGKEIYMSYSSLGHARRDSKVRDNIDVSINDLASFPSQMKDMDLYYDKSKKNYIYSNGRNKFVIDPNGEIKISREKTKKSSFHHSIKGEGRRSI